MEGVTQASKSVIHCSFSRSSNIRHTIKTAVIYLFLPNKNATKGFHHSCQVLYVDQDFVFPAAPSWIPVYEGLPARIKKAYQITCPKSNGSRHPNNRPAWQQTWRGKLKYEIKRHAYSKESITNKTELHTIKSWWSAIVGSTQGPLSLRQEADYPSEGNATAALAYTAQLNFQKIHNAVPESSSDTT